MTDSSIGRLHSPQARMLARRRCIPFRKFDISIPFGTVVLTLLIVMMLGADVNRPRHAFWGQLPAAQHSRRLPGATREDAMRMFVTRDGAIYFGNTAVDGHGKDIENRISGSLAKGAERRIYLTVDGRAKYADVSTALDAIRHAGIAAVTFVVESAPLHEFGGR